MKKPSATKLKKVKTDFKGGKSLADIIQDENLDVNERQLSRLMIRKFGTDEVGNPLQTGNLIKRTERFTNRLLENYSKDQIKEQLENIITNILT